MIKPTPSFTVCAAFIFLCFGVTPQANAALVYSNFTLPCGSPGFNLTGSSISAPQTNITVGFNPQEVSIDKSVPCGHPGGGDPSLDFSNEGIPLLNNPSAGSAFSIYWGMQPPGPPIMPGAAGIQFNLPMDATGGIKPPNPNIDGSYGYNFNATDGTNIFDIFFTITGSAPMDTTSWVLQPPGPPNLPAVQFNFNFLTAGDPTLSFLVYENGQQLSFSPASNVPEPATYTLLLAGLGLIRFMARRKQDFTA